LALAGATPPTVPWAGGVLDERCRPGGSPAPGTSPLSREGEAAGITGQAGCGGARPAPGQGIRQRPAIGPGSPGSALGVGDRGADALLELWIRGGSFHGLPAFPVSDID